MFFTRTHSCQLPIAKQDLINRLVGKHVNIHNIDFEVYEEDGYLHLIPHTEQVEAIKTLPTAQLDITEQNGKSKVVTTYRMRQIDSGGPILIVIFCAFLLVASGVLFFVGGDGEKVITYTLFGICIAILLLFSIRMQSGYFDYIRKIKAFIKNKGEATDKSGVQMPAAMQA